MVLGELGASLTSEMPPDALPVVVGANCTLKVLDCPGGRVSGNVSPLMLKPAPVKVPCAMVKLALPELVKVTFCTLVLPTSTLPKLTVAGVTNDSACTEISPLSLLEALPSSSLTSETLPDALPMVAGANCTLKVLDCPAARVSGRVRPVMLKPVPETVACETLTVVLPVFVSTTLWVLVVAAVTLPKLMFEGFGMS